MQPVLGITLLLAVLAQWHISAAPPPSEGTAAVVMMKPDPAKPSESLVSILPFPFPSEEQQEQLALASANSGAGANQKPLPQLEENSNTYAVEEAESRSSPTLEKPSTSNPDSSFLRPPISNTFATLPFNPQEYSVLPISNAAHEKPSTVNNNLRPVPTRGQGYERLLFGNKTSILGSLGLG